MFVVCVLSQGSRLSLQDISDAFIARLRLTLERISYESRDTLTVFRKSQVLVLAALFVLCPAVARTQGDPVLCKKLQELGERLEEQLTQLETNLDGEES